MACNPCESSSSGNTVNNNPYSSNCGCSDPCSIDGSKIIYTGPNLSCSGIENGDDFDTLLSKLDQAVCASSGDYSTYNTYCLAEAEPITTVQQFVETISNFVCNLSADYNTFKTETFVGYQSDVNIRFTAIELPNITCDSAGVTEVDTLQTVLAKYCSKFGQIDNLLNVSTANWNQCTVVTPAPTTIAEAFDVLIDQVCNLSALVGPGVTLPTFNNVGSCLAAPLTATDSLVDTVNKLKDRVCLSPTFDINSLTWNCIAKPSTTTTNLQDAFQSVLTKIDAIAALIPTFDAGQFTVANVDGSNPCLGKSVALAAGAATDKFVAINGADGTPGYLVSKLTAGTNITLDVTTTPGTMIINASGGAVDEKVLAFAGDTTLPNFLDQKLEAGPGNNGVSIALSQNLIAGKVTITPSINIEQLINTIIETVSNSTELFQAWCALNASCPSPCDPPSNIQVIYDTGTTTTSTTTTTTTTL